MKKLKVIEEVVCTVDLMDEVVWCKIYGESEIVGREGKDITVSINVPFQDFWDLMDGFASLITRMGRGFKKTILWFKFSKALIPKEWEKTFTDFVKSLLECAKEIEVSEIPVIYA